MINPSVRLKVLQHFVPACFEGKLMNTGDIGETVASLVLLFAYDEKRFNDPTALASPILLRVFMESLFGTKNCEDIAQWMKTEVEMKQLWETRMVSFYHSVNLR